MPTITHARKILGLLAATVRVFPLHESALITQVPKEHETEMAYAPKREMYAISSMLFLTGLLCFTCVPKPCTQMNDPAKEFLPQLNEMACEGQI